MKNNDYIQKVHEAVEKELSVSLTTLGVDFMSDIDPDTQMEALNIRMEGMEYDNGDPARPNDSKIMIIKKDIVQFEIWIRYTVKKINEIVVGYEAEVVNEIQPTSGIIL